MKRILKILVLSLVCICSFFVFAACKENPGSVDSSQESSQNPEEYFLLKDTALSLVVGDEYTLMADYYVEQGGELIFHSSSPSVAQVDNEGKITAIGEGKTTVTATLGEFSASCAVDVSFGKYVPTFLLNGIQGESVSVAYTDKLDFMANVLFNGKQFTCEPIYTLSNQEIGRIENGIFTPLQVGETEVMVSGEWNGMPLLPVTVSVKVVNAVEIELKEKNGEYSVNGIELYTYHQFGGKELQVSFETEVSVIKNGVLQTSGITVSVENADVIAFDDVTGTITALSPGTADLKINFTDEDDAKYEKTYTVTVQKPTGIYEKTVVVDASKGELPVDEIFADFPVEQRTIISVDGEFTVTDGKVFGFTVDNENSQEITVYNSAVGYKLTVIPYTRIFTSAEELAMFYMDDYETAYKGYYILGNDIDASDYVHADHIRYAGNGYKMYTNIGLVGTFDGKGHTIDGITIGRSGLFGMVGKGAVIKNVGFTNVKFSGLNEGNYAIACYICSATISNVYIEAKELPTTGWNNALVANNITIDCVVENCIFRLDSAYTKTSASFGSFTAISKEKEKFAYANEKFLLNCYVISPTPMTQDGKDNVCDASGTEFVYPKVKRYNTVADMKADTENDYTSFKSEFWDISSGIPVWKN